MKNILMPTIKDKQLSSPVLAASGTFGYGEEYKTISDYTKLGAIICKTITMNKRDGNEAPRLKDLGNANLNSIGLANSGVHTFTKEKLLLFSNYPCNVIVNIAGKDAQEFCEIINIIEDNPLEHTVWGWELNLSCPNVSNGTNIGYQTKLINELVKKVRLTTQKPILVKLPPCLDRIAELGLAAQDAGADAISAINTIPAMWIDTKTKKHFFTRKTAGMAGEAIFPIALSLVYTLCQSVSIPVIAIGGITKPDNAIQFLLAGASAIQIGSANFKDPLLSRECYDAIKTYFS